MSQGRIMETLKHILQQVKDAGPHAVANQVSQGWVPPPKVLQPTRRVLLVHAHPLAGSFSCALAAAVRRGLEQGDARVTALDLYALKFDPRLSTDERRRYLGPTADHPRLPPYPTIPRDLALHVDALKTHDAVVFVYPTWWYNVPAILKGWLDRVFLPGVAFKLPHLEPPGSVVRGGLVPCLDHITKMGIVSTYGSPRHITNLCGDNGRQMLCRSVAALFAAECAVHHHGLYELDSCDAARRGAYLGEVERYYREEFL